jgi:hypothetical protein
MTCGNKSGLRKKAPAPPHSVTTAPAIIIIFLFMVLIVSPGQQPMCQWAVAESHAITQLTQHRVAPVVKKTRETVNVLTNSGTVRHPALVYAPKFNGVRKNVLAF